MINATSSMELLVSRTLRELDQRFISITDEQTRLDHLLDTIVHYIPPHTNVYQNATESNATETIDDFPDDAPPLERIQQCIANLLHQIADVAVERIQNLESSELRCILNHFVALPFPVDDLVSAAEHEIDRRQEALKASSDASSSLRDALKSIPPETLQLIIENERKDPSKLVKKMIKIFSREQKDRRKDTTDTSESESASEESSPSLEGMIKIIASAASLREKEVNFPSEKADLVEFGRIQELIGQYRRIDFESGARLSRFNKEGQRLMAKRMMSRLLP